jgi:hypothetical protein
MIGMLRHTSLNITRMKIGKYLSIIMSIGAIWSLLDVRSSARGFSLESSTVVAVAPIAALSRAPQLMAQNSVTNPIDLEGDKNLQLQYINVTRNSSDKSLLTVSGSINNRSEQSHYVYYIVAKFVSNDVSIKQAIIPVNIDIEPGKSKSFSHEISTLSVNSLEPEMVKPVVVKYEYR